MKPKSRSFEVVELQDISGKNAKIYSIICEGDDITEFDKFLNEFGDVNPTEIQSIWDRLWLIGNNHGARETYFKTKEGKPGDLVCALYDTPDAMFRLYCIRYGANAVIIGGGGVKPKEIIAWQDDLKLSNAATLMIDVSDQINRQGLKWTKNGFPLFNNLYTNEDGEE